VSGTYKHCRVGGLKGLKELREQELRRAQGCGVAGLRAYRAE
jgi:hypothetical protein